MKREEFRHDLAILSTHSTYARFYAYTLDPETMDRKLSCKIGDKICDNPIELLKIFAWCKIGPDETDGFHPTNSGCIKLDDSYLFDIRCDHLIWIDFDDYEANARKTLLIGNHKGVAHFRVIRYDTALYEEDDSEEINII